MKLSIRYISSIIITLLLLCLVNLGLLKIHHYFFKKHIYDFEKVALTNLKLYNFTPFWEIQGNLEGLKLDDMKIEKRTTTSPISLKNIEIKHNIFNKNIQLSGNLDEKNIYNNFGDVLKLYKMKLGDISYTVILEYFGNVFSSKQFRKLNSNTNLQITHLKIDNYLHLNNIKSGIFSNDIDGIIPYFIDFDLIPNSQFLNKQILKFKFSKKGDKFISSLSSPHISYSMDMDTLPSVNNLQKFSERIGNSDFIFSINLPNEQICNLLEDIKAILKIISQKYELTFKDKKTLEEVILLFDTLKTIRTQSLPLKGDIHLTYNKEPSRLKMEINSGKNYITADISSNKINIKTDISYKPVEFDESLLSQITDLRMKKLIELDKLQSAIPYRIFMDIQFDKSSITNSNINTIGKITIDDKYTIDIYLKEKKLYIETEKTLLKTLETYIKKLQVETEEYCTSEFAINILCEKDTIGKDYKSLLDIIRLIKSSVSENNNGKIEFIMSYPDRKILSGNEEERALILLSRFNPANEKTTNMQ